MSVETTADNKRDEAKEYIEKAYKSLLIVLDPDTWGNSEYEDEYLDDILNVATTLMKLRRKL
jgi:hypothetical protein